MRIASSPGRTRGASQLALSISTRRAEESLTAISGQGDVSVDMARHKWESRCVGSERERGTQIVPSGVQRTSAAP